MPKKEGAKEKAANKAAAAAEAAGVLLCAREPPIAGAAGRACGENLRGLPQSPQPTDAPGERRHTHALRLLERSWWPWWRLPTMLGSAAGRMHATTCAALCQRGRVCQADFASVCAAALRVLSAAAG